MDHWGVGAIKLREYNVTFKIARKVFPSFDFGNNFKQKGNGEDVDLFCSISEMKLPRQQKKNILQFSNKDTMA